MYVSQDPGLELKEARKNRGERMIPPINRRHLSARRAGGDHCLRVFPSFNGVHRAPALDNHGRVGRGPRECTLDHENRSTPQGGVKRPRLEAVASGIPIH